MFSVQPYWKAPVTHTHSRPPLDSTYSSEERERNDPPQRKNVSNSTADTKTQKNGKEWRNWCQVFQTIPPHPTDGGCGGMVGVKEMKRKQQKNEELFYSFVHCWCSWELDGFVAVVRHTKCPSMFWLLCAFSTYSNYSSHCLALETPVTLLLSHA